MTRIMLKMLMAATAMVPASSFAQDMRGDDRARADETRQRGDGGERPQRQAPQQQQGQQQQAPQQQAQQPQQQQQQQRTDRFDRGGGRPDFRQQRPDAGQFAGQPGRGNYQRGGDRQDGRGQENRGQYNQDRTDRGQNFGGRGQPSFQGPSFQGNVQIDRGNDRRSDFRSDGGRGDGGRYQNGGYPNGQSGRPAYRNYDNSGRDRGIGRQDNRGVWNRGWRNDGRYNWNGYRASNRGAYRLPRYYAPSGWGYGYRRFSIGVTLGYGLFGQNYWIDDPYDYRLPQAYGPYRWVRYYDDALLVDIRSGRVVDAVYGIFW